MKFREIIDIKPESILEDTLPVPAEDLSAALREYNLDFESDERNLFWRGKYLPGRINGIREIVSGFAPGIEVRHVVRPVFDDSDFDAAPLWELSFPEISWDRWKYKEPESREEFDKLDAFELKCDACGKNRVVIDSTVQVTKVLANNKPLVSYRGRFEIIRSDVAVNLSEVLTGAELYPFDREEKYQYLMSTDSMYPLRVHEDEVFNYRGTCSVCGGPIFDMYFGPLRYSKSCWAGQDVIQSSFHSANVYSRRAAQALMKLDKGITRYAPVFLE